MDIFIFETFLKQSQVLLLLVVLYLAGGPILNESMTEFASGS